ncbi:hypothetical protein BAY59_27695 [Prauserella coralliicola]|nr:hypothetical protein BAY59_27695 [Prauserella coralliicola]
MVGVNRGLIADLVFADDVESVTTPAFTHTSVRFSFLDAEGLRWERNGNRAPVRLLDWREEQRQALRFRVKVFLYFSSPLLLATLIVGGTLGNPPGVQVVAVVVWVVHLIVVSGGVLKPTRRPH